MIFSVKGNTFPKDRKTYKVKFLRGIHTGSIGERRRSRSTDFDSESKAEAYFFPVVIACSYLSWQGCPPQKRIDTRRIAPQSLTCERHDEQGRKQELQMTVKVSSDTTVK